MTNSHRLALPATCRQHGTVGFTNLVVRKMIWGEQAVIEFDPHVDGSCVITLNEGDSRRLVDRLTAWLG